METIAPATYSRQRHSDNDVKINLHSRNGGFKFVLRNSKDDDQQGESHNIGCIGRFAKFIRKLAVKIFCCVMF